VHFWREYFEPLIPFIAVPPFANGYAPRTKTSIRPFVCRTLRFAERLLN
jgi:hypothetical protein